MRRDGIPAGDPLRSSEGELGGRRDERTAFIWLGVFAVLTTAYLSLHGLVRLDSGGDFFWSRAPGQWIDWLFWSAAGSILAALSRLGVGKVDDLGKHSEPVRRASTRVREALVGTGVAASLVALAASLPNLDLLGIKINLKSTPTVSVLMAFVLGLYSSTTRKLLCGLLLRSIGQILDRAVGRRGGDEGDVNRYVDLHVDPRLRRPYLLAASTKHGGPGHKASVEARVAYKVTGLISQAGFTVNALKTVFIALDLLPSDGGILAEIVAHEASHVDQRCWSDSLQQEAQAYATAARVMVELNRRGELKWRDRECWLKLDEQIAEDKVRDRQAAAPLYGMIPRKQVGGWKDKVEFVRQAACLGLDLLLGPKNPCRK
jgi:hypothetical protein